MSVLITSGIGDFIALESVLWASERSDQTIFYATPRAADLATLAMFCFPRLCASVSLVDFDGLEIPSFANLEEVRAHLAESRLNWEGMIDLNVTRIGREFLAGSRTFTGSSLLHYQLADIVRFQLPSRYAVIHPYSQNRRVPWRDMDSHDWHAADRFVRALGIPIVVLNRGETPAPASDYDLTNQTTLLEALEIVKHAAAFVGCSSVFSVMAGQVVPQGRMLVKGHAGLRDEWEAFYYPLQPGCVQTRIERRQNA